MANYDTVRNGISNLVKSCGYAESQEIVDFADASTNEYGNTFILKCESGGQEDEAINQQFNDVQKWTVQVAFARSSQNDLANYDDMQRKKDALILKLDNPVNWTTYVRSQKYKNWKVQEFKSYFVLIIELEVIDTYTY